VTEAVARAERPVAGAQPLKSPQPLGPDEKPLVFRSARNSSTLFVKRDGI
jgi:hypothetical protein